MFFSLSVYLPTEKQGAHNIILNNFLSPAQNSIAVIRNSRVISRKVKSKTFNQKHVPNKWSCFSIAFFLFLIAILSVSSAFAQNTTLPYSLSESASQAKSLSGYANKTADAAGNIANKTADAAGNIANKTADAGWQYCK